MPSFDIVSKLDLAEVDNALAGITREIATRFDFKGSKCTVERKEGALTILADDELKLKQMHELLKVHMTRRKVDAGRARLQGRRRRPRATACARRSTLRQGIDAGARPSASSARSRTASSRCRSSIQGDELRVTGKKRDDLQAAIALVRGLKIEQPLQYVNFRE